MSQRPFENPYRTFTLVDNVILDHIMPALSPAAWKVLCVALRQAQGEPLRQAQGEPLHRTSMVSQSNQVSPSNQALTLDRFMEKTGVRDAETLRAALQECVAAGYLVQAAGDQDGPGSAAVPAYALNTGFELTPATAAPEPETVNEAAFQALLDFCQEMEAASDPALLREAVGSKDTETVLLWIETGREMTHLPRAARFEAVLQRLRENVPPLPRAILAPEPRGRPSPTPPLGPTGESLWNATLAVLQSQLKKSQFQWFRATQGDTFADGTLVVLVPTERTRQWLEAGQLADMVQETVATVAGEPVKLRFQVARY